MRFPLAVALLAAVALAGCGPGKPTEPPPPLTPPGPAAVPHGPPTVPQGVKPPAPPPRTGRPDKPDFQVTADDLSKEVFADEKAAIGKYEGKWIELTGSVFQSSKILHHTGFVLNGTKKKEGDAAGYLIRCEVPPADLDKVWYFGKGQKVKVFAHVRQISEFMLDMDQGVVTELEAWKLLRMKAEDLAAEFAKDANATQEKYLGKDLNSREMIVAGTVADLAKKGDFQFVVLAGSGKTVVNCTFAEDDWKTLKKGDKVTIKGDLFGYDQQADNSPTVNSSFVVKKE